LMKQILNRKRLRIAFEALLYTDTSSRKP